MSDFVRKSDVLDLLYGIFDKYKMSTDKNTSIGKSFGTDVFEEIRNMPTAYSTDKVVEELEENSSRYTKKYVTSYGNNGYRDTKAISIHKAIEIVKHGGVSDDIWLKNLSIRYEYINFRIKRADWARSPDEGCVNRLYRAIRQLLRMKK